MSYSFTEIKPHQPFGFPLKSYRVIDGDTVKVTMDRGWGETKQMSCRIQGIDTPERGTLAGKLVTLVVAYWMHHHIADGFLTYSLDKGKYQGRYTGDIVARGGQGSEHWRLSKTVAGLRLCQPYPRKLEWTEARLKAIEREATVFLVGEGWTSLDLSMVEQPQQHVNLKAAKGELLTLYDEKYLLGETAV